MQWTDADIQNVKESADLVAVVSESVQVRRTGSGFMARCPFHEDKTPSLSISPKKGVWHCFSCQESGDIIAWVMSVGQKTFVEALRELGERYNYTPTGSSDTPQQNWQPLYDACETAAEFWHEYLLSHPDAGPARKFLKERGLTSDLVRQWRIGFCPNQKQLLLARFTERNVSVDVATKAGILVLREDNQIGLRFGGRVTFPVNDPKTGKVVGFGGRIMPGVDGPKYVNTSQGLLYQKKRAIYGAYQARSAVTKTKEVVFVEGYLDVIAAHHGGVTNTVAVSGTALGEEHLGWAVASGAERAVFCFDQDNAGLTAAERVPGVPGLEAFVPKTQSECKDAADIILQPGGPQNPKLFIAMITNRVNLWEWIVERVFTKTQMRSPEGRAAAAREAYAALSNCPDDVKRSWVEHITSRTGVTPRSTSARSTITEPAGPDETLLDALPEACINMLIHLVNEDDYASLTYPEMFPVGPMREVAESVQQKTVPVGASANLKYSLTLRDPIVGPWESFRMFLVWFYDMIAQDPNYSFGLKTAAKRYKINVLSSSENDAGMLVADMYATTQEVVAVSKTAA